MALVVVVVAMLPLLHPAACIWTDGPARCSKEHEVAHSGTIMAGGAAHMVACAGCTFPSAAPPTPPTACSFMLASGEVFGRDQPVSLQLLGSAGVAAAGQLLHHESSCKEVQQQHFTQLHRCTF